MAESKVQTHVVDLYNLLATTKDALILFA
uniref:Uncharacterized protein n=1 Tax=Arundo donax TaxID=35708 RepID=A0A0A9D8A8_ARUDO